MMIKTLLIRVGFIINAIAKKKAMGLL